jgi:hypothetical protein
MPENEEPQRVVRLAPKTPYEMIGEFLREIAALVCVFLPLDSYIAEGQVSQKTLSGTLLISLFLFLIGMALENVVE